MLTWRGSLDPPATTPSKEQHLNNEPDGDADNFESIKVFDTPERDNPKFGAVTLTTTRGNSSQTLRMTVNDAHVLKYSLTEYLRDKDKH